MSNTIALRGSIKMHLKNADTDEVLETREIKNLLVTQGRSWVLGQLESVNSQAQTIGFLAIGTSTVAPTTADTLLGSEVTRVAIGTWVTTTLTANPPSWQAQASFTTAQGNTTLAECGLFNTSLANVATMLAHATFTSFSKTTSNTLTISYTISA